MNIVALNDHYPDDMYTSDQVRELDRLAIEDCGIAGIYLMKRAGRAAFQVLQDYWDGVDKVTVFCGAGNNAGDGYVLAALAAGRCFDVHVVQVGDVNKLKGDALSAYQFAKQENVTFTQWSEYVEPATGVIVDALLGTGSNGELRGDFAAAVAAINASPLPVLSIDIPTGLCADTGCERGAAVIADVTVSFIGLKRGVFTGRGPACAGTVFFDDLEVPSDIYEKVDAAVDRLNLSHLLTYLPVRQADAHKGHFGHVLVVGGDTGMGGAVIMAAEAAARSGAGLVSVATQAEHVLPLLARTPEVMARGVDSGQALQPLLERASIVVIGPGLGNSPWSEQMLQAVVESGLPMVVDADALTLLVSTQIVEKTVRENWVLTPHPGEAARLLSSDIATVQADRFDCVSTLQNTYGGAVLLKGAGTLVKGDDDTVGIVVDGNPGMATGGMGDILSGVIAGLMAQGLSAVEAAELGACLHAKAGDMAAQDLGQRSLMATDLIPYMCELLRQGH